MISYGENNMSNMKDREKFRWFDNMIWKRTKIDKDGRVTLPKKIRQKLGLDGMQSVVLWISIHQTKKDNIFMIEIGVKK